MADRLFRDRREAGRVLAGLLDHYRDRRGVVVLALPRGGVPVGYEVATAEEALRGFGGRVSTWNLRDRHMTDTLDALAGHLGRQRGRPAKIVAWAHNSHLGDARATEAAAHGELNATPP